MLSKGSFFEYGRESYSYFDPTYFFKIGLFKISSAVGRYLGLDLSMLFMNYERSVV